ncbi:MAG: DUF192 domain-containing protein [Paracoccus sp. (in: a-proteobacteria)]|nr:DUF192 domain-containing protein [Paracoccus sp. (in: a-proteobacteria)]
MRAAMLALALILAPPVLAPHVAAQADLPDCRPLMLAFESAGDHTGFVVELADTPARRAEGLMFRETLPQGHGMLFIYEQPQFVAFWMKNTLIPLDMVFMDGGGVIRHIHEGAVPGDLTSIPGARPGDPQPLRQYVLEIGAGEAARLGLAEGQQMRFPYVPDAYSTLPLCAA